MHTNYNCIVQMHVKKQQETRNENSIKDTTQASNENTQKNKNRWRFKYCYDLALQPSIICLGIFRIACRCIFNLWHLRQGVDSLAQWLEHWVFIREDRVRIQRRAGNFFSYASFFCYGFHVVRWELVWDWTLLHRKSLRVIKNDEFLEKGELK